MAPPKGSPVLSTSSGPISSAPYYQGKRKEAPTLLAPSLSIFGDDDWEPLLEDAPFKPALPDSDVYPTVVPPSNFSRGGRGLPRSIRSAGKVYKSHDGAGLCSPGRWNKEDRLFPMGKAWDSLRRDIEQTVCGGLDGLGISKQVIALACGNDSIFNKQWPGQVRATIHNWLSKQTGDYPVGDPQVASRQPFFLDLLFYVLREARDPDFEVCRQFAF